MTIPPIPHLAAFALGALGIVALVRLARRERRRVNEELDMVRSETIPDHVQRPTLKRDPRSGVYRP
jgi:hypothetical protein